MRHVTLPIAIAGGLAAAASTAFANTTYYIDQLINYTGSCTQPTLFDDTTALKSRMDAASWTGSKYSDASAWAKDFREQCSSTYGASGLDSTYADNKSFAVFSGHGSASTLYFGTANDTCTLNIDNESRLGSMSGAQAATMHLTILMFHRSQVTPARGRGTIVPSRCASEAGVGDDFRYC